MDTENVPSLRNKNCPSVLFFKFSIVHCFRFVCTQGSEEIDSSFFLRLEKLIVALSQSFVTHGVEI